MSNVSRRVLLVEDEPADALLVRLRVGSFDPPGLIVHESGSVADAVEFLNNAGERPVDVVLLDLGLPDGRGLTVVERILEAAEGLPVIVLTGRDDDAGPEAVAAGAQDYLVKADTGPVDLERSIRYAVTRQRELNKLAAANRDIEQLVYSVTHDLKNPLMVASGFVGVLFERHADALPSDMAEALERVERQHQRMADLIADLLHYARTVHGELTVQPNDLGRLVKRVLNEEALTDRTEVVVSDLPELQADPRLLRQIVTNILVNAVKYQHPDRPGRIEITAEDVGWGTSVTFRDNGRGVPTERRAAMFDMFSRGPGGGVEGTGMGLAIVKRAVERHDGSVRLEDGIDGGLSVVVTWPHDPVTDRDHP